jgi:hypothetical protein
MEVIERTLDRLVEFDEKSRLYLAVDGIEENPFRSYTWACDQYNDQGHEGACVGFAWSHELSARPKVYIADASVAAKIYYRARMIDQWEGEDYDGTSVLAGIKATMEIAGYNGQPLYGEYRWAFGIQDVARTLGYRGPVVLGINWHYSMYTPDENNFISPTGQAIGGHAILANGIKIVKLYADKPATWDNVDLDKSYVRLHNSWGINYGDGGDCYITLRDLDSLLQADGEACIPVLRRI